MWFGDCSNDHLQILIPSDDVVLRSDGQDVQPAVLSGQLILHLSQATDIRDVKLTFVGKLTAPHGEPLPPTFGHNVNTSVFFSKDWTFLDESKSRTHTMKAGQIAFPFQLTVDDSFPSSVTVAGASIVYKLRATVIRSPLSSNWVSQRHINVIRGFTPEALEYTRTLEVENTWSGKIMYDIMIPHKVYAAGDDIPVSFKFMPLAKGCSVLAIHTVLKQYLTIRSSGASLMHDDRAIVKAYHVIRNGQAVDMSPVSNTATTWNARHAYRRVLAATGNSASVSATPALGQATPPGQSAPQQNEDPERGNYEISTSLKFKLPAWITPSNATDPIVVRHKIGWSITLSNLDGHSSDLYCGFPIHILHPGLLEESRSASQPARAILFPNTEVTEAPPVLPSYVSHIQDRIANALDPTIPGGLAPNPLHYLDLASVTPGPLPTSWTRGTYLRRPPSSLPSGPAAGPSGHVYTPSMGLIDSGLLMSLGDSAQLAIVQSGVADETSRGHDDMSLGSGRWRFRTSLINSITERRVPLASGGSSTPTESRYIFSKFPHRPFVRFSSRPENSQSPAQAQSAPNPSTPQSFDRSLDARSGRPSITSQRSESLPDADSMQALVQLMSRVPNYERASQGFLGGGAPPLDASVGLPTYEEVDTTSDAE